MFPADLYTKVVLTIIALCLAVLCVEESRWNRLETVQAQSGQVVISGYAYNESGSLHVYALGNRYGDKQGIPVAITSKYLGGRAAWPALSEAEGSRRFCKAWDSAPLTSSDTPRTAPASPRIGIASVYPPCPAPSADKSASTRSRDISQTSPGSSVRS
jgi:hypothetical protein